MARPHLFNHGRNASTVALAVVWVMLMGQVTWMNVISGLLLAMLIQWLFPMPSLTAQLRVHPWKTAVLLARFAFDLVRASWHVAWLAIRPRPVGRGSLVDVQLHLHDDLRRTIIAEFTSLVPGTVVIDVHPETSILTIHVLDITDEDQLRRERENIWALERRVAAALEVRPTPLDDQHDQAGQDNQEGDR